MSGSYLGQMFLVGLGGFVGSSARFVVGGLVHRVLPATAFPFGTLVVNLLGCLLIGFFGGMMEVRQLLGPMSRLFLLVGVLGGFTTYSSFAYETLALAHVGDFSRAGLNVVIHVVIGLLAAWAGYIVAQQL